ncbi:MAG: WD40 repeat domain-containing protein [Epsilonproteobacteria bacterium]|nr:WD40 repeat domain-containing protein [Campylobacterota bacterium]
MNKQLLTFSLTAALSFHAGFAMDEERLAEKNEEKIARDNLQHMQPLNLRSTSIQDLLSTTFSCRSIQELIKKLKVSTLPVEPQEAFLQNNIERFYPELFKAYKNKFGYSHMSYGDVHLSPNDKHLVISIGHGVLFLTHENNKWVTSQSPLYCHQSSPSVIFSPNSQLCCIAGGSNSDTQLFAYQDNRWNKIATLAPAHDILFSADSNSFVLYNPGESQLWHYYNNTWQPIKAPGGSPLNILSHSYEPNLDYLYTSTEESSTIQVWTRINNTWQHKSNINPRELSYDLPGERVGGDQSLMRVIKKLDDTINIFKLEPETGSYTCIGSIPHTQGTVLSASLTLNDQHLIIRSETAIVFWSNSNGTWQQTGSIDGFFGIFDDVSLSYDSQCCLTVHKGIIRQILTYQNNQWQPISAISDRDNIKTIGLNHNNNKELIVEYTDGSMYMWYYYDNAWHDTAILTSKENTEQYSLSSRPFSPDGQHLILEAPYGKKLMLPTSKYFKGLNIEKLTDLLTPEQQELIDQSLPTPEQTDSIPEQAKNTEQTDSTEEKKLSEELSEKISGLLSRLRAMALSENKQRN